MKRELRDVLRLLEELERALREKEILVLTLGREIKEHTSLLDRLEEEKREAEKQAMTSGHLLQQLESEMSRVRERIVIGERERQRLAAERQEQEGLIASRQIELTTIEQSRAQFETLLAAGHDRLARYGTIATRLRRLPRSARLAWLRSKSGTVRPRPCWSESKRLSLRCASAPAFYRRRWNRRAPRLSSGRARTCSWRRNWSTSKPSAMQEKRGKACCSLNRASAGANRRDRRTAEEHAPAT